MADTGDIPFGNLIDYIRNREDDEFEASFDETYGDPNAVQDDDARNGLTLVVLTVSFLLILALLRYCCFFVIDYVIMCKHRGFLRRNLSRCCPCWFPSAASDEDSRDPQSRSNNNNNNEDEDQDDPTATNTSTHSNSSDGIEESANTSSSAYARRLVTILTDEQKRSIFASLVNSRKATAADIGSSEESEAQQTNPPSPSENDETTASTTTTQTRPSTESIGIPYGSAVTEDDKAPDNNNNNNDNDNACCPICIQDIALGDNVYHCKNCRHLFHFDCILEWLGTGSTLCPYCRREIFTKRMLEEAYRKNSTKKHEDV